LVTLEKAFGAQKRSLYKKVFKRESTLPEFQKDCGNEVPAIGQRYKERQLLVGGGGIYIQEREFSKGSQPLEESK